MNRMIIAAATGTAVLLLAASPAGACVQCNNGEVTGDGVLAQARSQMSELNQGYGGAAVPNCNDEDRLAPEDGNDEVEHQGYLRWVPDFANDPTPPRDGPSVEWYQQICYIPERPDAPMPGVSWRRFEYVAPEILAQVAVDDALAAIPTQRIESNPDAETHAMVAIPTWFWVSGIPEDGVSSTASIPGVTVTASASPGGVQYDFGDGTSLDCTGTGTPYAPGATSDCTHDFQQAGTYTITATILWTGTYTVNGGAPIPIETAVARTATFDLAVDEAQAINTRPGG